MFAYLEWSQHESKTDNQMNENKITYVPRKFIYFFKIRLTYILILFVKNPYMAQTWL